AFFIEGLINLYEATFDLKWLSEAERLADTTIRHFDDKTGGGCFFTADDAEQVLDRGKDGGEGEIRTGKSVMIMNLLRLAEVLDRKDFTAGAERLQRAFAVRVGEHPTSAERMLAAVDFYWSRPKEIVLIARADGPELSALRKAVWQTYMPNRVVVGAIGADLAAAGKKIPRLGGRDPIQC